MPDPFEEGAKLSAKERLQRSRDREAVKAIPEHTGTGPINYGDLTQFKKWKDGHKLDALVGGPPCQGFSIAGERGGMDDIRSQLSLTFVEAAAVYRSRWVVWENVCGVFSIDNGRAFASVLAGLSGREIRVPKDGWGNAGVVEGIPEAYGLAWRVLDSQYMRVDSHPRAVPQRRKRVFIVGHLGACWQRAAAVLFEAKDLCRNSPPRRRKREDVAPTLEGRTRSGGVSTDFARAGGVIHEVSHPLTGSPYADSASPKAKGKLNGEDKMTLVPEIAWTLQERDKKGADSDTKEGHLLVIDTTQITSPQNRTMPQGEVCHTLSKDQHPPAIALAFKASHFTRGKDGAPSEVAPSLSAEADKGDQDILVFTEAQGFRAQGQDGFELSEVSPPVLASRGHASGTPCVAFPQNMSGTQAATEEDVSPVLQAHNPTAVAFQTRVARNGRGNGQEEVAPACAVRAGATGKGDSAVCVAFSGRMRGAEPAIGREERPPLQNIEHVGALDTVKPWNVTDNLSVRRLMPVECERLMGRPDGFTFIPYRGGYSKDGPRYSALGLGQTVNVVRWIGLRIQMVDEKTGFA